MVSRYNQLDIQCASPNYIAHCIVRCLRVYSCLSWKLYLERTSTESVFPWNISRVIFKMLNSRLTNQSMRPKLHYDKQQYVMILWYSRKILWQHAHCCDSGVWKILCFYCVLSTMMTAGKHTYICKIIMGMFFLCLSPSLFFSSPSHTHTHSPLLLHSHSPSLTLSISL